MPDVLHIVVVLQHVDELLHVFHIALAGELDVILGDHLHLGADEGIPLLLQSLYHVIEGVWLAGDLQGGAVGLEVRRAGVQSIHHDGVLVQLALLVVNDDDALFVEGPADAALGAQVAVALVKGVADLRGGTLAVVGQGVHDDGHAAGAVALVGDGFVVVGVAGAQGLVDGALDIVVGHVDRLGLGDDGGKAGVVVGVAGAALLHRHDDLAGNFSERGGALGVGRALGFLNIMPFGMSGHSVLLSFNIVLNHFPVGSGFCNGQLGKAGR